LASEAGPDPDMNAVNESALFASRDFAGAFALLAEMTDLGKADGTIVMINGAPTDNNASMFKAGAHSVFDESGLAIGRSWRGPWRTNEKESKTAGRQCHCVRSSRAVGSRRRDPGATGERCH